jgi:hypothetical protein
MALKNEENWEALKPFSFRAIVGENRARKK